MNLVVKAHRPWKSRFIWGIVALILVVSGWTLFDYGRFLAGYDSRDADGEIDGLMQVQDHLEKRIETLEAN